MCVRDVYSPLPISFAHFACQVPKMICQESNRPLSSDTAGSGYDLGASTRLFLSPSLVHPSYPASTRRGSPPRPPSLLPLPPLLHPLTA